MAGVCLSSKLLSRAQCPHPFPNPVRMQTDGLKRLPGDFREQEDPLHVRRARVRAPRGHKPPPPKKSSSPRPV